MLHEIAPEHEAFGMGAGGWISTALVDFPRSKYQFAAFNAEAYTGWILYEWLGHTAGLTMPFIRYEYQCNRVAAEAKFVELAQLTWELVYDGSYGDTPDDACVGYCRVNPASAYYQASTIVQIRAIAQPGFVFKHWGGKGKAWTHAEEVSGGGWVVDGAGQDLEGITADTIYINMGDGGAKPKPKDRDLFAVFCPCVHEGTPQNGSLKGDTPFGPLPAGLGRYSHRDVSQGGDDSGCLLYIHKKIKETAAQWHAVHDDKPVLFNDISKPGGGSGLGHASHENGLDVDIAYQSTVALSNNLVGMFASSSDIDLIYVGAGYATGGPIQFDADHYDHFHVRYDDPD